MPPHGRWRAGVRRHSRVARQAWAGQTPHTPAPVMPLLPHRLQTERLGEQHIAELSGIHLNRRPGIQGTPKALCDGLIDDATDTCRDLPCTACLGQPTL